MELIWLDAGMRPDTGSTALRAHPLEQGILKSAKFDSEIGTEYGFTLKVPKKDYKKLAGTRGGFVYPRGAFEFGGKITNCQSNSEDGSVTFYGLTWFGIWKIYESVSFAYASTSRQMSAYISEIMSMSGYENSIYVPDTQFEFANGFTPTVPWDGKSPFNAFEIMKSLYEQAGLIPTIAAAYDNNEIMRIMIGTRVPVEYHAWDFSSDVLPIEVEKQFQPVTEIEISCISSNGTICPVKRAVMDETGLWQTSSGSVVKYYDFSGRKAAVYLSQEEYDDPDWDSIIASVQVQDYASVRVVGALQPDVGDLVTGKDETTGIEATAKVTSKTLHISDGVPIFSFETA